MIKYIPFFLLCAFTLKPTVNDCIKLEAFKKAGWTIHDSSTFGKITNERVVEFNKNKKDYILDMTWEIRMTLENYYRAKAFDKTTTPSDTMYGDILFILFQDSANIAELRWFDGKKKNVVLNNKYTKCALWGLPRVSNSLF